MKKVILIAFILFSFNSSYAKKPLFRAYIVQGEKRYEVGDSNNRIIKLHKAPFHFEIKLLNLEGVYLNASYTTDYYKVPFNKKFADWEFIRSKTMVEESFNEHKLLEVDKEAICYWFYIPKENWHRFDKEIKFSNDTVIGRKSVDSIDNTDDNTTKSLHEAVKPLYIVFIEFLKE